MGGNENMGRVGSFAVALGVGAAIAGWGSGIAHAEDGESTGGGPAPDTSETVTTPAVEDPPAEPTQPTESAEPAEAAAEPVQVRTKDRDDRPRRSHQVERAAQAPADPEPAPESEPEPAENTQAVAESQDTDSGESAKVEAATPTPEPAPVKAEIGATAGPGAAAKKVTASALFTPGAEPSKQLPGVAPQLWTLAAFARRDLETKPAITAAAAQVQTSAAVPAAAPNSVTYTAQPTLFDRVAVVALKVIREVSKFLGVNLYGLLGKAMASSNPPFFVKFGLDVQRTEFEVAPGNVWKVWEFTPPEPSGKTVIAVHGGGFILEPILLHWADYADMARRTGATVVVPIYPLATTERGAAVNVVPAMADFISARIAADGAENVSIYADSAGPNLVLGAFRELVQRGDPLPASMVLVSFTPDLSLSNPDALTVDDPILDLDNLEFYADENHWGDGLDPRDPMISPLFLEDEVLQALPPTTIYVGSLEFVLPDTLLFHERAVEAGATISTVVGVGQYHDWPIGGLPINSQAPKVRKAIFRQLGLIV